MRSEMKDENEMHGTVRVGWTEYVLPMADALKVFELLSRAEIYEIDTVRKTAEDGKESHTVIPRIFAAGDERGESPIKLGALTHEWYCLGKTTGKKKSNG
jgi:hypothetical protein